MNLKVDEKGNAVLQEGKPIYVSDDGKEILVDVPSLFGKITALNTESATRRREVNEIKARFATFDGIEDLADWTAKAQKALDVVKNLDDKKLIDANQVEALKANLAEGYKKQLAERDAELGRKDKQIHSLAVSARFAASPWFSGEAPRTILPPDVAESYFGKHFKVEASNNGPQVVGLVDGHPIYSREKPGEIAGFDEALEVIISAYPMKDRILRAGGGGSGASGNTGGFSGNSTLEQLRKDYEVQSKAGNMPAMMAIKDKIFALEQQQRQRGG